jgi:hypothetical protein
MPIPALIGENAMPENNSALPKYSYCLVMGHHLLLLHRDIRDRVLAEATPL